MEDLLEKKLKKINLQITQKCNFRCKYCVYSGEYNNRNHQNKSMDWVIAKKGIDFLLNHSRDSSSINVSFYGGEPLIEFELIKKCMKYVTTQAEGKAVGFNLTSNGSLLNEEVIEFFLKYNVSLAISLDGPREIHDINRVYANGCGTFDTVYNNLRKMLEKYPDFRERLQYSIVINPALPMSCINEFIAKEEDLFSNTTIIGSHISNIYRKNKLEYDNDYIESWEYTKFKYFLYLLDRIKDRNESSLLNRAFVGLSSYILNSHMTVPPLDCNDHHSGPCIPGLIRLFMNVDGTFYPCERVSEESEPMKIGNVHQGFDYQKVRTLLNIGKLTQDECRDCFVFRDCTVCAAMADVGESTVNELSRQKKLEFCQNSRNNFEMILKDVCTLHDCGLKSEMIKVKRGLL